MWRRRRQHHRRRRAPPPPPPGPRLTAGSEHRLPPPAARPPPPSAPLTCLSDARRGRWRSAPPGTPATRHRGGAQHGPRRYLRSGRSQPRHPGALRSLPVHLPPLLTRPSPASARTRLLRPSVEAAGSPGRSRAPIPAAVPRGGGVVWRSGLGT